MRSPLALRLLAIPTLLGSALSLLMMAPAIASGSSLPSSVEASSSGSDAAFCPIPSTDTEYSLMDFTTAESDAAVLLFGCDCPPCLNALYQLRNPSIVDSVQGHCWNNFSRENYQQYDVDQVLDAVEEANQQGPDTPLNWNESPSS